MGAPVREFSPLELRRMKQAVEDGVVYDDIARRFHTNYSRISREASERGWKSPERRQCIWGKSPTIAQPPDEAACGVRRVLRTATGKPIGYTEPLDSVKRAKPRFVFFG